MGLRRCSASVDQDHALRFAGGDGEIAFPHPSKEPTCLLLEAVFIAVAAAAVPRGALITAAGPPQTARRIGIEQDREVGLQVSAENTVQLKYGLASQFPAASLVSLGRIRKAIAEHDAALFQRRLNHFRNVLGASCKHERHFGQRRKAVGRGVEQHTPNFFTGRSSARLAGFYHFEARRAQNYRELPQLSALAGAVESFKGNEFTAPGHVRNHISAYSVPSHHGLL